MGLGRPSYEGPTGLIGALHDALDKADLPVISLRVSVPHYVPSPPNPEATRSLLARFQLVTGSVDELLPSGDDLAAELQAFLRDQRDD